MTSGQLHNQPHNTMEVGNSNQELLSKGTKKRTTAVVLCVILVAFVVAALLYFLKTDQAPKRATPLASTSGKIALPLKSLIQNEYYPKVFNGSWISDSEIIYKSEEGNLMLFDAVSNRTKVLLSKDLEVLAATVQYRISADKRYIFLAHNYQKLYRHTFLAYYRIVDLETKKDWPLTDVNGAQIAVQHVAWAPVGNAFVYVYMNDIYYRSTVREQSIQEYRITHTGRLGTIYNGVPDWVYEEEILLDSSALWFSPDGRHLAFATFNDSRTPVMNIPYYGTPGDLRFQYTQSVNIRYPKPGRPNPIASLSVIDLAKLQFEKPGILDIPPSPELKEPILTNVAWADQSSLVVVWMNRVQNQASIISCAVTEVKCRSVMNLFERAGWVKIPTLNFSPDGGHMMMVLPFDQGGRSGNFRHVALIDIKSESATSAIPLTSGKYTVTGVVAVDEKYVYFTANTEKHPSHSSVNRVQWTGAPSTPREIDCVSCHVESCTYSGGVFSDKSSYLAQTCAGPVVPQVTIMKKTGEIVRKWEDNRELSEKLENIILPITKTLRVEVAPGLFAMVQLSLPPNYDPSGETKYPLLVNVYGGPETHLVDDKFTIGWETHLIVNQSLIYAKIDGRGSGLQGDKMMFANYRRIGTYEIHDQINVTRYLVNNFPFIDPERIGIWGWSYGGYAAAMALALDDKDVFKCGISVAPVTDWLLYDTMYTERFMGLPTPDDNLAGYEIATLNNKIDNFRKKKFFLVHGTLDDNVHFQQSMMLAKALEKKDILFEQQSYPDEAHSLADVKPHLYHTLGHFLHQCFHETK